MARIHKGTRALRTPEHRWEDKIKIKLKIGCCARTHLEERENEVPEKEITQRHFVPHKLYMN
jgi:hypothetical protein